MSGTIDVLVVDEDPEVLELTGTFLERKSAGIAVETEQNARAAVDRAATGEFDCVVSDYRMPEMDGLELFEAVGERRDVPFVMFTAEADNETGEEALAKGVAGFVEKRVGTEHYDELVEHIESAVES